MGGLRTLVDHGRTGSWSTGATRTIFAAYAEQILGNRLLAAELSAAAAHRARDFTWSTAGARLRRIYGDLTARSPVTCDD